MREATKLFFKNKGLKKMCKAAPLNIIFLYVLFYWVADLSWYYPMGIIVPSLIILLLTFPYKYALSDDNSIEFYHVFGKAKSKTIQIKDISEISFKRSCLQLYYRNLEDAYPKLALLELSEHDMPIVVDELLKRNPAIEIS